MKIDELADVFLNSANFVQLYFDPKNKVSNLADHLSLYIKYCDLHLKEKLEKTNFISLKKHLPKAQDF